MSLAAHTLGERASPNIQPACAMLQPQLPTDSTASSSSTSSALERVRRPSEDAESSVRSGAAGAKRTTVMSSECVDVCARMGLAGFLGSLNARGAKDGEGYSLMWLLGLPVEYMRVLVPQLRSCGYNSAIWRHVTAKQGSTVIFHYKMSY